MHNEIGLADYEMEFLIRDHQGGAHSSFRKPGYSSSDESDEDDVRIRDESLKNDALELRKLLSPIQEKIHDLNVELKEAEVSFSNKHHVY